MQMETDTKANSRMTNVMVEVLRILQMVTDMKANTMRTRKMVKVFLFLGMEANF